MAIHLFVIWDKSEKEPVKKGWDFWRRWGFANPSLPPPNGAGARKIKGGRPRNLDDDWAWIEVREKNRKPEDVYPEWLTRIGTRAVSLADSRDSFNKAISLKRKKGKEMEKTE
jgi:hypothetical protein